MASFQQGARIQLRVIQALIIRELTTRFGRENIGFLWVMAEPLLFAVLVGLLWRFQKGEMDHGVNIIAFVATGYIPFVMFRSAINRAQGAFTANSSLLYHRQVKILDILLVRFLVEMIGHLMAWIFIAVVLGAAGQFPMPYDLGYVLLGWLYYSIFTFSVISIVAPLSEMSEVLEKILPVTVYMMIPFSGAFVMNSWLTPAFRDVVMWSPAVHGMEMMRYGVFGDAVYPQYSASYPWFFFAPAMVLGLYLCRRLRKHMVVE
ncbi:capsule biosynthesis protein [Novosphingobium umbonatum]|uniref:Capsule biosynthesis protein n=1 Tax=Novosphingobium umbonatum TaxID=1908524 RepID=A0A3S2Y4H6_9SPHN|nr:ABC transporter permease [Novosphingobium umbonatum]RVU03269.1 capsule biosynthesis protein [Novosphingobium umbonatum]